MAGSGENDDAAAKPLLSSLAERRMARRKEVIQRHITLAERAIAEREVKDEREALVEVLAGLRRLEAELDAAEDAEAWAAAHPPRKMPEERVAKFRDNEKTAAKHLRLRGIPADVRESLVWSKESAAAVVREYEANGFVEIFEEDVLGLPRNYMNLLLGWPTQPGALSLRARYA